MTKHVLIASILVLGLATSGAASAQQFPFGSAMQMLNAGNAQPPRQDDRSGMKGPASADRQRRKPTHIIPPQSHTRAPTHHETSGPSNDND